MNSTRDASVLLNYVLDRRMNIFLEKSLVPARVPSFDTCPERLHYTTYLEMLTHSKRGVRRLRKLMIGVFPAASVSKQMTQPWGRRNQS